MINRKTPPLLKQLLALACTIICFHIAGAQDSSRVDKLIGIPDKIFGSLSKKADLLNERLDKQTAAYFKKLEKQERKLKRKLEKKDSLLAAKLFSSDLREQYTRLKSLQPNALTRNVYSGHLDSLKTALQFFQSAEKGLPSTEVKQLLGQYQALQQQLNFTEQARKLLVERKAQLREAFENLGMVKELKRYQKQAYYYQAQVKAYRDMFEDPSKMEARLLELAMKVPAFKEFFARNSMLGSLFALPDAATSGAGVQGLQTRASINQLVADRFGSGAGVGQMLQQNIQAAQGQLSELKNKVNQYTSGVMGNASSEIDAPDFKPNTQKTKGFLKRLEVGTNLQSQKARYFFPVTTDLGLSLGYKLNDKSIIGIGASGKMGWGQGWDSIRLSYQGLGLRSFVDWQLKGSLYISGGYEMNYRGVINTVQQLQDRSAWQQSGLLGLSKKYSISKKLKGDIRLLWDFLSYRQVPVTQPVLFRIGYQFKK